MLTHQKAAGTGSLLATFIQCLLVSQIRSSQCEGFVSAHFGGPEGIRTLDLRIANAALLPVELQALVFYIIFVFIVVELKLKLLAAG